MQLLCSGGTMVYTEPRATKPLKGSVFICLHRKGHRISIQNYGDCIMGNCSVFSYQYQKVTKLSNANSFVLKSYEQRMSCLTLEIFLFWKINYVAFKEQKKWSCISTVAKKRFVVDFQRGCSIGKSWNIGLTFLALCINLISMCKQGHCVSKLCVFAYQ